MDNNILTPYAVKSALINTAITNACDALSFSSPMPAHPVRSILARLTSCDLAAIRDDLHPLWVSERNLSAFMGAIYCNPAKANEIFLDWVKDCTKDTSTREVKWDEIISIRKFNHDRGCELGESPLTGVNSIYLSQTDDNDKINIQQHLSLTWLYLGNPNLVELQEGGEGAAQYIATYSFDQLMATISDLMLRDFGAGHSSPIDYVINQLQDKLRAAVPHWDALKVTRESNDDDETLIKVSFEFTNHSVPLLMANVLKHAYCG